jgi:hypothetical protein
LREKGIGIFSIMVGCNPERVAIIQPRVGVATPTLGALRIIPTLSGLNRFAMSGMASTLSG